MQQPDLPGKYAAAAGGLPLLYGKRAILARLKPAEFAFWHFFCRRNMLKCSAGRRQRRGRKAAAAKGAASGN